VLEPVDLASVKSVERFISRILTRYGRRLTVLVNNAASVKDEKTITGDGLEMTFQVNVWVYFRLMQALLPTLARNRPASVVNVASGTAYIALRNNLFDLDDIQFESRKYYSWDAYMQSKAAELMLSWKASRLWQGGVAINAVHPGILGVCGDDSAVSGLTTEAQSPEYMPGRCDTDPFHAAQRPIWLAVQAPLLNVSGSWWYMEPYTHKSVQYPLIWTNVSIQDQLWSYCDSVLAPKR